MRRVKSDLYQRYFCELLDLSGKSIGAVAELAQVEPSYVFRVKTGERLPSGLTTAQLVIGLVGDLSLVRRHDELGNALETLLRARHNDDIGAYKPPSRRVSPS